MKAISDVRIRDIVGIPVTTLQDWKKKDRSDYRRVLYDMLKNMSEEELKDRVSKEQLTLFSQKP